MIQAITETNLIFTVQTEDNRINTAVASSKIRHLVKFTNDMDKSVLYAYPTAQEIFDRYTKFQFTYNVTNRVYSGDINLIPAGYWKYEVFEVSWIGTVTLLAGNAPITENDVLTPAADDKGVVQGLVTKGKMYVAEKDGTQQVQYTQHPEPAGQTNYIYYGQ